MLAVWVLPRLGIQVRNNPEQVRLRFGTRELRFSPATGWRALGFSPPSRLRLAVPQLSEGSLYVPTQALEALGIIIMTDSPQLLEFVAPASVPQTTLPAADPTEGTPVAAPGVVTPPPLSHQPKPPVASPSTVSQAVATLQTVRVGQTVNRNITVQRVVLELSGKVTHDVQRLNSGLLIRLPGVSSTPSVTKLPSGQTLEVRNLAQGKTALTEVTLMTSGGQSKIFTLDNPFRVVIDTTLLTDSEVPPPIDPEHLPAGVAYRATGKLHLLSFDPAKYQPRVVSAATGQLSSVAELVRRVGGVAGVNASYFDPDSKLPVDLVIGGGLMTAASLEKRATLGFLPDGNLVVGYPRPRYILSGPFGSITVNTVGPRLKPDLLTAFVGDGRTPIGADNLTTLYLAAGKNTVARALTGRNVPPTGTLAFTFDPQRFGMLPRSAGAALNVLLNWQAEDPIWAKALDALSAGPMLVRGGQVAINAQREAFNPFSNVWRPTRQVAFGVLSGQPTIAYFEYGTPEAFAAALAGAGMSQAVRLDSGSSATAYLTGGYTGTGGYLNTVWSRQVVNAIVLVPRG